MSKTVWLANAAMKAVRDNRNSSVSIFTTIEAAANKYHLSADDVAKQVIRMYPEFEGILTLANYEGVKL